MNREILSELKNIRILSAEIINFIKKEKKNVDKHILFDIKLCVEEALRNAIVHGNKSNKNLPVNIFYDIEGDNLKVIVRDKGNGFNVRNLPNPTNRENLYKEDGRGVYLIHKLMDKVQYSEKGNSVTMIKKLEE